MHAVPKSEHSREIMLPRSPAVLAQSGMEALVAAGVVAPEAAGRALLACWTSVHGLASLAVTGHLPLDDELTLEAALDAVLRTAHARRGRRPGALPARAPAPGRRLPGPGRARARAGRHRAERDVATVVFPA